MASLLSGAAGQRGSCGPLVVWQRRALSLPPAAATSAGGDPNLAVQLAIRRKEGTAPAVPEVGLGSRPSNQLLRATLDREISEMGVGVRCATTNRYVNGFFAPRSTAARWAACR